MFEHFENLNILFLLISTTYHIIIYFFCHTGVGTRNYYRKLGYELDGPYMSKLIWVRLLYSWYSFDCAIRTNLFLILCYSSKFAWPIFRSGNELLPFYQDLFILLLLYSFCWIKKIDKTELIANQVLFMYVWRCLVRICF